MPRTTTDPESIVITNAFKIIVDNREQAPWRFSGITDERSGYPLIIPLVTNKSLATGDYSIEGLGHLITVERKSVGDFRGSVTAERERFEREMERMANMRYADVVIEGSWADLTKPGQYSTSVSPKVFTRTIASWSRRYGVHFWLMDDRRCAEVWAFRLLLTAWKQLQEVKEGESK